MADTLGHRGVFGLLIPYFNTVVEPELASLQPIGVTNQTARFALAADVLGQVAAGAAALAASELAALMIGLSTESFAGGLDLLAEGARQVRERTGRPVFTASHATQAALRAIGARRIAVVTPFDAEANRHVAEAMRGAGFEVVAVDGLAAASIESIGQTPEPAILELFRRVDRSGVDAIAQIGTGLPVLRLVDALEAQLGVTIVAANAAMYWQALRSAGIADRYKTNGRLLREY